jgi:molybdopterin synthase catalytic subunit
MTVRVRLFAWLREAAGTEECWLALRPGARGLEARTALLDRYARLRGLLDHVRPAVNQEYQSWEMPLSDGDELALIPPVSGG